MFTSSRVTHCYYNLQVCLYITGVHALENTLHVDLVRPAGVTGIYDADYITKHLNTFMLSAGVPIRFVLLLMNLKN